MLAPHSLLGKAEVEEKDKIWEPKMDSMQNENEISMMKKYKRDRRALTKLALRIYRMWTHNILIIGG